MTSPVPSTKSDLVPLASATLLVPYSRDYIGRLARSGKIISTQIDKQWFIDPQSIVNFYEHSSLEDSVKKRILSQSRKNDLEAKELLHTRSAEVVARVGQTSNASLSVAIGIMVSGLFGGLLVESSARFLDMYPQSSMAVVLEHITPPFATQVSSVALSAVQPLVPTYSVSESEEKMSIENGIVLFPAGTETQSVAVSDLFSDDVTVVMQGTTSGFVRLDTSDTPLPFVRVPKSTQ